MVDLRGSLAYRFAQFAHTCGAREPGSKAVIQRAIAASPFTYDTMLKMRKKYDSTLTVGTLNTSLKQALPSFFSSCDNLSPMHKATFCKSLPTIIGNAVRETQRP